MALWLDRILGHHNSKARGWILTDEWTFGALLGLGAAEGHLFEAFCFWFVWLIEFALWVLELWSCLSWTWYLLGIHFHSNLLFEFAQFIHHLANLLTLHLTMNFIHFHSFFYLSFFLFFLFFLAFIFRCLRIVITLLLLRLIEFLNSYVMRLSEFFEHSCLFLVASNFKFNQLMYQVNLTLWFEFFLFHHVNHKSPIPHYQSKYFILDLFSYFHLH